MDFKKLKKGILLSEEKNDKKYIQVFETVLKNIELLQAINTEGIEPADFPYEVKRTYLRKDDQIRTGDLIIMKENTKIEDGFVVVKQGEENE